MLDFGIVHTGDSEVRLELQDKFATCLSPVFLLIMCIIVCILGVLILTSLLNYFTTQIEPGPVSVANKKASSKIIRI